MGNGSWSGQAVHPGRGRFLIKTVGRAGIPVKVELVDREIDLYNTDYGANQTSELVAS